MMNSIDVRLFTASLRALILWIFFLTLILPGVRGQKSHLVPGTLYRAELLREDGNKVIFNFQLNIEKGKWTLTIRNGAERIRLTDIIQTGDSLFFNMPVFESYFRVQILPGGDLRGTWIKPTEGKPQLWPFYARAADASRFPLRQGKAKHSISGRWEVTFTRKDNTTRPAVAEWKQTGNAVTGSFLTPTGDYRYLQGVVTGDSLFLSTFDGAHAYYFHARIDNDQHISGGLFTAGAARTETWTAIKNEKAALPENQEMALKEDSLRLRFCFPDLEAKMVCIGDPRYRGKVVVIQIMGSWCPNCLDETRFLSEYYDNNRKRGVEIIALAYEYTVDTARSRRSLDKFRQRFNVHYPMLITGVTNTDSLRAEKTLPQLTSIAVFPTSIFIGKDGKVKKIHTGFYGPGTGEHYDAFRKAFNETVNQLLNE